MSIDKNPQARAMAYRKAKGSLQKIAELGITPDMSEDAIEELVEKLAEAKAVEKETNIAETVAGQRWFVERLVRYSGMTTAEVFEEEYSNSFADVASEDELLENLENIRSSAA